jgi:hypothetical protein
MSRRRNSLVPGLVLVGLGLVLLVNRLEWAEVRWFHIYPLILIALGVSSALSIRGRGNSQGIFPTFFFLTIGIFFVLRNYGLIPRLYVGEFWPIFLIAPGLGLIATFLFVPSEWRMLIPGGALVVFGCLLMADKLGYVEIYRLWDYWPVLLIALGLSIFFKGYKQVKA